MDHRPTAVERAFELAKSSRCATVADIRRRLKEEGYSVDVISGRTLLMQLRNCLRDAGHQNG